MAKFYVKLPGQTFDEAKAYFAMDKAQAAERFVQELEWKNVSFPIAAGEQELTVEVARSGDPPLIWEAYLVQGVPTPRYRATKAP